MVRDLVEIGNGTDDLGADMSLAVVYPQLSPCAGVVILDELRPGSNLGLASIRINPLLYLNGASAIIELVCYVCRLV